MRLPPGLERDWPGLPILEFAEQIRVRSGCREILRIAETAAVVPAPDKPSEAKDVVVAALLDGAVVRRAPHAVVVVDTDAEPLRRTSAGPLNPTQRGLSRVVQAAPFSILVSRERDHDEFVARLDVLGITPTFVGSNTAGGVHRRLAICEPADGPSSVALAPDGFSATAVITVFNEEDVLETVLDDLKHQGIDAYILDNWSTDSTWEIVQARRDDGVIGAEHWPSHGPEEYFDLKASLDRVSEIAASSDADWFIKHDADEIRRAPWPDVRLIDALWMVQCAGYNVVDFTVMNYEPVDSDFVRGRSLWNYFRHFNFGTKPGHFRQLKAWRQFGQTIDYARFGSHRIVFDGLRIFPYKFQLHHYPIRSQDHGARKILTERQTRYLPAAHARGWHRHYDYVSEGTSFIKSPDDVLERTDELLASRLVELLSGAGIERESKNDAV